MNNEQELKKTKVRHPDRITLTPSHLDKIDGWIAQVVNSRRGVRLTRNNVISWILEQRGALLSETERHQMTRQFYDEERFLRDAIQELRKRKASGENVTLKELLSHGSEIGPKKGGRTKSDQRKPLLKNDTSAPDADSKSLSQ